jgi:hypothetical protein
MSNWFGRSFLGDKEKHKPEPIYPFPEDFIEYFTKRGINFEPGKSTLRELLDEVVKLVREVNQ